VVNLGGSRGCLYINLQKLWSYNRGRLPAHPRDNEIIVIDKAAGPIRRGEPLTSDPGKDGFAVANLRTSEVRRPTSDPVERRSTLRGHFCCIISGL